MKFIERYGYRKAKISKKVIVLPRRALREFEINLIRQANAIPDNHTVYKFQDESLSTMFVMFTDFVAVFGTAVKVEDW